MAKYVNPQRRSLSNTLGCSAQHSQQPHGTSDTAPPPPQKINKHQQQKHLKSHHKSQHQPNNQITQSPHRNQSLCNNHDATTLDAAECSAPKPMAGRGPSPISQFSPCIQVQELAGGVCALEVHCQGGEEGSGETNKVTSSKAQALRRQLRVLEEDIRDKVALKHALLRELREIEAADPARRPAL